MEGPLNSLKILDFTTLLPGPFGTMMLADMGADVIRIESPDKPDLVRLLPPYVDGVSAAFAYLNRSKRSLALNLKSGEAIDIIKKLIQEYDIVVEQFRPGTMDRLGVGYEALKAFNPRIIYCSITGYGQNGPYRDRAGHDVNYLSIAGVTGYNGRKSTGPGPINLQIADVAGGGYHAVMGILAAVVHRNNTGEGQYIDISMTDAVFSMHALTAPIALIGGEEPKLEECTFNGGTYYDCYETADGRYFSLAGIEPQFFYRLCDILEHPEWKDKALAIDPEIQKFLRKGIAEAMKRKTFAEWKSIFAAVDCCSEPVLTFFEACEHPQIKAREMLVDVPSGNGTQKQLASPIRFSKNRPQYKFTGAALGLHTTDILKSAGYSEKEIGKLKENKTVTQA